MRDRNEFKAFVIKLSNGNPGALGFLMNLFSTKIQSSKVSLIVAKINCLGIKGTEIYILYNDLGNRDIEKVFNICDRVPSEVLRDACARQDGTGVSLIAPYIKLSE